MSSPDKYSDAIVSHGEVFVEFRDWTVNTARNVAEVLKIPDVNRAYKTSILNGKSQQGFGVNINLRAKNNTSDLIQWTNTAGGKSYSRFVSKVGRNKQ